MDISCSPIDPYMDENPLLATIAQLLLDDSTGNEEIIYELEVVDPSVLPKVTAFLMLQIIPVLC